MVGAYRATLKQLMSVVTVGVTICVMGSKALSRSALGGESALVATRSLKAKRASVIERKSRRGSLIATFVGHSLFMLDEIELN